MPAVAKSVRKPATRQTSAGRNGKATAAPYLPERLTIPDLQRSAAGCKGCDLWKNATQTVFGEGPAKALVMFVGNNREIPKTGKGILSLDPRGAFWMKCFSKSALTGRKYM